MEKPSLMELKRQQWAREREEAKIDWCPWGRPGCGAPLKWNRSSARSDSRLTPVDNKKNDNYLPPLNWTTSHPHEPIQAPPATAPPHPPPPPPPRRSKRHASHTVTDGETSGYQSDNHFIDPSAPNYHLLQRRQLSSSRGPSVEPMPPPDTSSSVIIHHHHSTNKEQMSCDRHDEANVISARADYKFLERKKWVQDGTVPYDLYPECLPQLYDRSTPPRWVARPTNAFAQTEPLMSERTLGDSSSISRHQAVQHCATNAAPSFLRGQNVVVDVAELAERERKRAKANELQRVLLQQLAEKENQKLLEKKRQQEEEERQEQELQRHLEAERRQIEEERRRVQEKKEAEERRLEAVKEAIAGAQQNALAEKLARRRNVQNRPVVVQQADNDPAAASVSVRSEDGSTPAHQHQQPQPVSAHREPVEMRRHAIMTSPRPQLLDKGTLTRSSVDAQVQTDQQQLQVACRCETTNNPRSRQSRHKIAATTEEERPATQMSMIAVKSQTSTSTANRPQWNAHKTNAKYQSQTEKDPRFLQRRRERLRRRQKLLLEKQLHGSWPSSENSGSQEEMGDIFFPFLPGSGTGVPHERYYEALQAAAVSRYYKKAPAVAVGHHHQHRNSHHAGNPKSMAGASASQQSDVELIQPAQLVSQPPVAVAPTRSQSRQLSSPPVPALLKKIQMSSGDPAAAGATSSGCEKHQWENDDSPSSDQPVKIDKDFENLQIKEQRRCTEQDKQDLLYRLSVLKQSLEQRKTALDKVSLTSQ